MNADATPSLYHFLKSMKNEIDRHKWIESEKRGYDIGLELALMDWMLKYRAGWKRHYLETYHPSSSLQRSG